MEPISNSLQAIPDFDRSIRRSIATEVIRPTFKSISKQAMSGWLGLAAGEEGEIDSIVKELGWKVTENFIRTSVEEESIAAKPTPSTKDAITLDSTLFYNSLYDSQLIRRTELGKLLKQSQVV